MNGEEKFVDLSDVKWRLHRDGWLSPDTYCNYFAPCPDGAAVYLFMLHADDFANGLVAYVGMSTNLRQRWAGHPILKELRETPCWPMRWFKPTPAAELRDAEQRYISAFNPPWNIQGKQRGIVLS